jgi:hypothetical protein
MSAQQRPSSIPRSGGALCLCDQVSSTNEGNQATLEGRANGVPKPPSGDPWPCDSSAPPVSGWGAGHRPVLGGPLVQRLDEGVSTGLAELSAGQAERPVIDLVKGCGRMSTESRGVTRTRSVDELHPLGTGVRRRRWVTHKGAVVVTRPWRIGVGHGASPSRVRIFAGPQRRTLMPSPRPRDPYLWSPSERHVATRAWCYVQDRARLGRCSRCRATSAKSARH